MLFIISAHKSFLVIKIPNFFLHIDVENKANISNVAHAAKRSITNPGTVGGNLVGGEHYG